MPAAQLEQLAAVEPPLVASAVPAGQLVQPDDPTRLWNWPVEHASHLVAPELALDWPAAQPEHDDAAPKAS